MEHLVERWTKLPKDSFKGSKLHHWDEAEFSGGSECTTSIPFTYNITTSITHSICIVSFKSPNAG